MIHNDDKQIANRMKEAINKAILDIDKNMSNLDEIKKFAQNANFPGSTAVACLISPTHIYLINCGDSKAIFVSDNRIKSITREHLVIFSEEKTRIENANGIFGLYDIYYKGCKSNITRSFGDYHFKANLDKTQLEQIITAQPDIHVNKRSANDEFILLASKSVWNTFDTENLKNYIHSKLKTTDNLSKICQEIEYIFFKKVKDQGMCIILVGLLGSSKIDDAEITKENQFNDKIKNNVEKLFNQKLSCQKITDQIINEQEIFDRSLAIAGIDDENILIKKMVEDIFEENFTKIVRNLINEQLEAGAAHSQVVASIKREILDPFDVEEDNKTVQNIFKKFLQEKVQNEPNNIPDKIDDIKPFDDNNVQNKVNKYFEPIEPKLTGRTDIHPFDEFKSTSKARFLANVTIVIVITYFLILISAIVLAITKS